MYWLLVIVPLPTFLILIYSDHIKQTPRVRSTHISAPDTAEGKAVGLIALK